MESKADKQWAAQYLLDPLTAPGPNEETGPGTHFVPSQPTGSSTTASISAKSKAAPTVTVRSRASSGAERQDGPSTPNRLSKNPYRSHMSSNASSTGYPTPPSSAGPDGRDPFANRADGYSSPQDRYSTGQASSQVPTSTIGVESTTTGNTSRGHRSSSLGERFPGDTSHQPLNMIKQTERQARHAPHLRKHRQVGADTIDSLDDIAGVPYHHEGPYDATLRARNLSSRTAPVQALAASNREALRATAPEKIKDSLEKHYPLDGVAAMPPGVPDQFGRVLSYREGSNMMIDDNPGGGAYKRWGGVKYLPEDIKGKGEPSYSLERALKSQQHRRNVSDGGIEMTSPQRHSSHRATRSQQYPPQRPGMNRSHSSAADTSRPANGHKSSGVASGNDNADGGLRYADWQAGQKHDSGNVAGKLRQRLGSLKIKHHEHKRSDSKE